MPLVELVDKERATLLSLPEFVAVDCQSVRVVHSYRHYCQIVQIEEARTAPYRSAQIV
jgi:hypothetical protein